MHIPSLAPFCFSVLLPFVCIHLCLPWPYLVGVKRKKPRCVFAVRCWRLQQQLPEEAGVEGQYSYWWLLRKRKWEERFMRTKVQGVYNLSEAMKNAQASLQFRVTEKQDVNGCCSWHLIHRAYICCVCSVQECLMTTLTFILNGKCEISSHYVSHSDVTSNVSDWRGTNSTAGHSLIRLVNRVLKGRCIFEGQNLEMSLYFSSSGFIVPNSMGCKKNILQQKIHQ